MEKFRDLEYKRPDLAAVKKECLAHLKKFEKAQTFEEANAEYLAFCKVNDDLATMAVIAHVRNTMNMKDEFYDAERKFFNTEAPKLMPMMKKSIKAMLKSPFRPQFEEVYGKHLFKQAEVEEKLINMRIIFLMIRENALTTEYSKTAAACSTEFRGENCNFYGLLKHMQSTDREERREAFLAWAKLYEGIAPKLDELYGKLVKLRCKTAKRLGFANYIDYVYLARGRYDYTAKDVKEFREAVRKYITPICEKLFEEQRQRLGVDRLHWYDESLVFPDGNAVPTGTTEEKVKKAQEMYRALSPETGEFFDFMVEHELFDLETRENKHLGGYCTSMPSYKAPFIFSNFNGTSADVDVLTHEAGHAFENYYASRRLPISDLAHSTSEINEIHSMTMEHLTYPYMDKFFGDKADRYRYAHFCESVKTIPYLVSVDEFQHRVFENPQYGPEDWRKIWREIEKKYMPWRDYDGNDFLEGGGFWMQKQHVFLYPFYYVDYALAQMGAFSIYRKEVEEGNAFENYLKLCSIGGKYGYFETLERAGIPLPLKEETVRETAAFIEKQTKALKEKLG